MTFTLNCKDNVCPQRNVKTISVGHPVRSINIVIRDSITCHFSVCTRFTSFSPSGTIICRHLTRGFSINFCQMTNFGTLVSG